MLYHGTNSALQSLKPQAVVDQRELIKVGNLSNALYASEYYQEALVHAVSKAMKWDGHAGYGHNGEIWSISLPVDKNDMPKSEKIFIYELDPKNFKKNSLDEWYTDKEVVPVRKIELTIGEALGHFDEVRYLGKKEDETHRENEKWL